jgi:hypothetical protein
MIDLRGAFDVQGEKHNRLSPADFLTAEEKFGITFPTDFKELSAFYGSGTFEDFVRIYCPLAAGKGYRLADHIAELDKMVEASGGYRARLFPWGNTFNGDELLWAVDGPPDAWPVVIRASRDAWYEEYEMGCVDFLLALFAGKIQSEILGDLTIPEGRKPKFDPSKPLPLIS